MLLISIILISIVSAIVVAAICVLFENLLLVISPKVISQQASINNIVSSYYSQQSKKNYSSMTKEKIVVFVLISICSLLVFPLFFRNSHNKTKQRLADNNKVLIQIDTPVKDKDSHIGGVLNAPPTNEHIKRPMNKDRQISDYSHKREFTSKIATKIFHLKKYSYLDASAVLKDKGKQQFLLLLRDSFDETFVLEIRYSDQTDICILNRDKKGFAVIKDYLFEFQILGVTDEGIFLKVDFGYAKK